MIWVLILLMYGGLAGIPAAAAQTPSRWPIESLRVEGNRHYNASWHQSIDMRNMLVVSEAMARAALARKESRGGHAREDFPEMDKSHFAKVNVVARKTPTGMQIEEVPHPDPPPEIKQVLEEG